MLVRHGNRPGEWLLLAVAYQCLLGGIGPTACSILPTAQAQQTLGNLEWALDNAGFALRDVVRTWFYNDDILAWYDAFNVKPGDKLYLAPKDRVKVW